MELGQTRRVVWCGVSSRADVPRGVFIRQRWIGAASSVLNVSVWPVDTLTNRPLRNERLRVVGTLTNPPLHNERLRVVDTLTNQPLHNERLRVVDAVVSGASGF